MYSHNCSGVYFSTCSQTTLTTAALYIAITLPTTYARVTFDLCRLVCTVERYELRTDCEDKGQHSHRKLNQRQSGK